MTKEISNYGKVIIFSLSVLLFIYLINIPSEREEYLNGECVWTIGKTIKYSGEFNECIEYNYFVDGKLCYNSANEDENVSDPLKRFYLVKYSKIRPEFSEMYLDKEITDSIKILKTGYKVIDEKVGNH
jgi:hypothetical protein